MIRIRIAVLSLVSAVALQPAVQTALDRYVAVPDPNYKFSVISTKPDNGYTTYVLDMVSQAWRSPAEVDRPLWQHWLTIVKPDKITTDIGFLFITGGANNRPPPTGLDPGFTSMAVATGSVVAELRMVPNQPLTFIPDDKRPRVEDALIAYTWDKYLRTGDETWPARLPMTKAAVRAMDTVTKFCSGLPDGVNVSRFVVSGGSKRGWTAWTTAAADKRVIAVVPFVIDLLNLEKSFIHHWRAYGFWAPAVKDYTDMKMMDWMGTPQFAALMKIEEPYSYRDRLTMPKLMINATGDEFFLPDSSQFYYDDLKGEKHLRYVPNSRHSMAGTDARQTLEAFYSAVIQNRPRPRFSWKFDRNGSIRVKAVDKPGEVRLWQATNSKTRDFRVDTIGPVWTSTPLELKGDAYIGSVGKAAAGWTAFFVELTYPSGGRYPYKLTTGVRVVPDTLPFAAPKPTRRAESGSE
jgi:PhoPQ-activated pathogenicity-related protein